LIHHSLRHCHSWKQSWYAFLLIMLSSVCEFSAISWIVWNRHHFKVDCSLGNMKKSAGAKSGE
jgi:hypothetical protein